MLISLEYFHKTPYLGEMYQDNLMEYFIKSILGWAT